MSTEGDTGTACATVRPCDTAMKNTYLFYNK